MTLKIPNSQHGFTLIEMMLVMVVIGMLLYAGMNYMQQKFQADRIDRTALQMQQILNAGLAYYVNTASWPVASPERFTGTDEFLQRNGYLLPGKINNPWGLTDPENHPTSYSLITDGNKKLLTVVTYIGNTPQAITNAQVIAGKLPMGITCQSFRDFDIEDNVICKACADKNPCYVGASVNVPGENLNNATAINYAGLYHSGACVKMPTCPIKGMVPSIMVVPVSVTGASDEPTVAAGKTCTPTDLSDCQINSYPITSFTGVALANIPVVYGPRAPDCGDPYLPSPPPPSPCLSDSTGKPISDSDPKAQYWRVCLQVASTKGNVTPPTNKNTWGQLMGTVMVLIRCSTPQEHATDSGFDVYQN